MKIHFWGVRGSMTTPLLPSAIQAKLAAILERALPEDFVSAESKKRFIDGLPPWLYGAAGGNSPCVSIDVDGFNEPFIFDCGSGIREMGIASGASASPPSHYHLFFSHFHWDHLIGFPFFTPAYNPLVAVDFYSPRPELEPVLRNLMSLPYFPVQIEYLSSSKKFNILEQPVSIGPARVAFKKMKHPGDSFSYKLSCGGKRCIYATDVELSNLDFEPLKENVSFFKDADIIIIDAQYTPGEAVSKYNWGHSDYNRSVDFALYWGIKHLVLFHHDPGYDDRKLYGILQSAHWYLRELNKVGELEISLATEELEIVI